MSANYVALLHKSWIWLKIFLFLMKYIINISLLIVGAMKIVFQLQRGCSIACVEALTRQSRLMIHYFIMVLIVIWNWCGLQIPLYCLFFLTFSIWCNVSMFSAWAISLVVVLKLCKCHNTCCLILFTIFIISVTITISKRFTVLDFFSPSILSIFNRVTPFSAISSKRANKRKYSQDKYRPNTSFSSDFHSELTLMHPKSRINCCLLYLDWV